MMVFEWMGCVFGVAGALLLATNTSWSRYGWALFLAPNVFWIGYVVMGDAQGLLLQQVVFTGTSLLGVYRWVLRPGTNLVTLERNRRQRETLAWAMRTFGATTAGNANERIRRFAEEAIELAQAGGMEESAMAGLVRYVYSRPVGETAQEVGGVSIALLGYCEFAELSADECEQRELARVLAKDAMYFRAKQNAKAAAGVALPSLEVEA